MPFYQPFYPEVPVKIFNKKEIVFVRESMKRYLYEFSRHQGRSVRRSSLSYPDSEIYDTLLGHDACKKNGFFKTSYTGKSHGTFSDHSIFMDGFFPADKFSGAHIPLTALSNLLTVFHVIIGILALLSDIFLSDARMIKRHAIP